MSQFGEREQNFEAKFAHDEELRFKVFARRNKLLGLWAAHKLGLAGQAAEDYAIGVIKAGATSADEESVFAKVRADFDAKAVSASDHQIRREMHDLLGTARHQIMTEEK